MPSEVKIRVYALHELKGKCQQRAFRSLLKEHPDMNEQGLLKMSKDPDDDEGNWRFFSNGRRFPAHWEVHDGDPTK